MMAQLHISLLGTPQIQLNHAPIELERRKALALFAYLLVTKQAYQREALASLFFPDVDMSRALAYLRNTLWTINKGLGDNWLETERDTVRVVPQDGLWVDIWAFEAYETNTDLNGWQSAVALYRDEFMRGFSLPDSDAFDEWQFFQSQSLRGRLNGVLEKLTRGYIAQNRYEEAIPYARRWVVMDNLSESAHRNLMRLYDWTGQRTAALKQYQMCADLLKNELGIAPDEKTRKLYQAIQSRQTTKQTVEVMALTLTTTPDPFSKTVQDNLPVPSTPFVSRERDLTEITRLLTDPSCRLLTLIGQGGIGKTRLSIQSGEHARQHFEDGVYFVSLVSITSPESLIGAIAESLRFGCITNDLKSELFDYLRLKRVLLILDNFEHLLDYAELLAEILANLLCGKMLITSRERLNLREEWIYEMDGLTFPLGEATLAEMPSFGAVALFTQSAKQIQPDFALTEENIPHIARISQLVEGLPLGIELAAGWLQMLSPKEIAQEIQRSYDFLSASLRNLPPRHRSMKAVFESSWERLSSEEAHTLCRLAIFSGGFDRHAANQVANAPLPILLALANKSLIRRTFDGRYDIHELLRQFAEAKLATDAPAYHQAKARHSLYYADWLQSVDIEIKGAHQIETLNAIERDFGNIRMAWSWVCEQKQTDTLHRLLDGLMIYFIMRSRDDEARQLCDEALHYIASDDPATQLLQCKLEALWAVANRGKKPIELIAERFYRLSDYFRATPDHPHLVSTFFLMHSLSLHPGTNSDIRSENVDRAEYWAKRAETTADKAGDTFGKIVALRGLGWVAHERIDYVESKRIFQQTLMLSQQNQDTWNEGESIKTLAEVAYTLGEYPLAEELTYQGLLISEKVGDRGGVAFAMSALGSTLFRQGKYEESEIITQKSIELWRDLGNMGMIGWQKHLLGELDRVRGNYTQAVYHLGDASEYHLRTQSRLGNAWCYCASAWLHFLTGELSGAEQSLNHAQMIFERNNHIWGYVTVDNHRAEIACSRGDLVTAQMLIDRAIENAEKCKSIMFQTRNWVTLGRILADGGDKRGALVWLEKAIAHHATWADVRERAINLRTDYLVALARG